MNSSMSGRKAYAARLTTFLGTASFLAIAGALDANAGEVVAQAEEIPETVLITGSLIRGTAAVGVPVVNLAPQDFAMTGSLTAADLFRSIPQFNVLPGPTALASANVERGIKVNLRQLDTGSSPRSLMMVDSMRYPPQGNGLDQLDPSIIPQIAIERIDLLLDGASATYGSDAIAGVINIILKRNYDGALVEGVFKQGAGGNVQYQASAIWGRTWDGGQITLSYSWADTSPTQGNFHSKFTYDHTPWGFDDRRGIGSSMPGTLSTGAPSSPNPAYPGNLGQNCTNCYAIPLGTGFDWDPGAGGLGPVLPHSAPTLNWATDLNIPDNSGTNGTRNVFNPYSISYYSAATQNTGGAMTVDQRLTSNVSFYGEAFWSMRRATFNNVATGNHLLVAVPTFNPYYPTGGPSGSSTLRVAYNMNIGSQSVTKAWAAGSRYAGGLNIALPGNWAMQAYYSMTRDAEFNHSNGNVNKNAVSAALGWTLPITPAIGTTPAIATWTKPANVPYLNLFCDATQFTCNSPTTLNYIQSFGETRSQFLVNEKGLKADGPLFDLPGGTVKMAVGANYTSYHFHIQETQQGTSNPTVDILSDAPNRQVWAVFAQLNVPIFSDQNGIPFIRRLELEASWRHDQYSDVGGTSNPKIGLNWAPFDALTIRGGWGNSFRAPNFGENSPISNVAWNGFGFPSGVYVTAGNAQIHVVCDANGQPAANSGGAKLFNAGFGCGSQPAGLSLNGGGKAASLTGMRDYFNQEAYTLKPELATNWAIGFDYSPTGNFLTGLNIQATYYIVKINGILQNFGLPTDTRFNDPSTGFAYIVPSDVGCPGMDATPWLCANFQDIVTRVLSYSGNPVPLQAQTLVYWVNDGGTQNKGWQKTEGIDWQASYDWEWEGLGAFNTGITGTYYLSQKNQRVAGDIISDFYHTTLGTLNGVEQVGVESRSRLKYRARLGWSDGTWSVTGFMDYSSHFFHTQAAPPNVNFACLAPGGTVGGGTQPCAIMDYTNIIPSYYTFDLSLGYDTGDRPANEYLRNVAVQVVVQNIMDRHSAYEYRISTGGGGNPCACDVLQTLYGRVISLRVQKTW